MKQEDIFNAMGISTADQKAMLEDESNVSLFKDAISKTHITRAIAVDDTEITGKAVKAVTDILNKSHQTVIVEFGKSLDVTIDPNSFTKDGVFDSGAFNTKATTDLGTALTKFKEDNKGDETEKVKALEISLKSVKIERDTYQETLKNTIGDLDTEKERNAKSEKQTKVNGFFADTFRDSIKFDESENALTIEAIEGRILKGATHGLDENGKYTVTQLDGKPFMNESKTNSLTPSEVHLKFAVDAKAKIVMNGVKKTETKTESKKEDQQRQEDIPSVNQDVSDKIDAHIKAMEAADA